MKNKTQKNTEKHLFKLFETAEQEIVLQYFKKVEKQININATETISGKTFLHNAVIKNFPLIINYLLEKNAAINVADNKGNTPLHFAVLSNNDHAIDILLSNKADTTLKNAADQTPLFIAAWNNQLAIAEKIYSRRRKRHAGMDSNSLEEDEPKDICLEMEELENPTLNLLGLHLLIKSAWLQPVEEYFEQCSVSEAIVMEKDIDGQTILHYAAFSANPKLLTLLKDRLDTIVFDNLINAKDNRGETPIFKAASIMDQYSINDEKYLIIVKLLEEYGADIHVKNNVGQNLLHISAMFGSTNLINYLVKEKNFLIDEKDNQGNTALILAASIRGDVSTLYTLYQLGASFKAENIQGETAISQLMYRGNREALESMRVSSEDFINFIMDNKGELLGKAAEGNALLTLNWLDFRYSLEINYKNSEGKTALYRAAENNAGNAVDWLLDKQADPYIRANNGFNAYSVALNSGYRGVATRIHNAMKVLRLQKKYQIEGKSHQSVNSSTPVSVNRQQEMANETILTLAKPQDTFSKIDAKMLQAIAQKNDQGYNRARYYIQYKHANFSLLNAEEVRDLKSYAEQTNRTDFLAFLQIHYPNNSLTIRQSALSKFDRKMLQEMDKKNKKSVMYYIQYKNANFNLLKEEEIQELKSYAEQINKTSFLTFLGKYYIGNEKQSALSKYDRAMLLEINQRNDKGYNKVIYYIQHKQANFTLLNAEEIQDLKSYAERNNKSLSLVRKRREIQVSGLAGTTSSSNKLSQFFPDWISQGIERGYHWINNLIGIKDSVPKPAGHLLTSSPYSKTYPTHLAISNQHTEEHPFQSVDYSCQIDNLLFLLNFFIRCMSRVKAITSEVIIHEDPQREAYVYARVSELLNTFERFIRKNSLTSGLDYDTVSRCMQLPELQKKLVKALYRDSNTNIQQIFRQHSQGLALSVPVKQSSRFFNELKVFDLSLNCVAIEEKKLDFSTTSPTMLQKSNKNVLFASPKNNIITSKQQQLHKLGIR